MAAALRHVVLQHLRVAWDRYAADPTINNALIATESGRWGFVRDYRAARMGRRLRNAMGWLRQLGACTRKGLSAYGEQLLERMLRLSTEAA
jgi:hypothetical protein